jgi:hypothetical protein
VLQLEVRRARVGTAWYWLTGLLGSLLGEAEFRRRYGLPLITR